MPEELNRVLTDQLSDVLFVHSASAADNLAREGIARERISFAGNTMIDTLVAMEPRFRGTAAARAVRPDARLVSGRHAAPPGARRRTAARRASWRSWAGSTSRSSSRSTRARAGRSTGTAPAGVTLLDPLGYVDFLSLQVDSAGGPDGLGRHPGGDHVPRRPVLHAAREHRTPRDRRAGDEHDPRPRSGTDRRHPGRARGTRRRAARSSPRLGRPGLRARGRGACGASQPVHHRLQPPLNRRPRRSQPIRSDQAIGDLRRKRHEPSQQQDPHHARADDGARRASPPLPRHGSPSIPLRRRRAQDVKSAQDLRQVAQTSSLAGTVDPGPQVVTVSAPGGFDWGDAAIGAAGGLGLALAAIGGTLPWPAGAATRSRVSWRS